MVDDSDFPLLLTPGPLTTTETVKQAMLHDWGSRDAAFIEMTARVRAGLAGLAGVADEAGHVCVPLQGSGTFAVEATLQTALPRSGKLLVLVNGTYGARMVEICARMGRAHAALEAPEDRVPDLEELARMLAADPAITHVAAIHCETTSGILNPIEEIADVVAGAGRRLIVDAMSSFGALPLDLAGLPAEALAGSANKCLQGVPGLAFVLIERATLEGPAQATSLSLDLADQWRGLEASGQWRFTPPTQVVAALDQALTELAREGGVAARQARYEENCRILLDGLGELGLESFLPRDLQAPIIVTFHAPADANYHFETFYELLRRRGYAIYPGKLTRAPSFRIGCIGDLDGAVMKGVVDAVSQVLGEMGVTRRHRAPP